jgi:hypothetical protein
VDINNAVCTSVQAGLDFLVILGKVVGVQVTTKVVVKKILPSDWQSEDV